MIDIIVGIIALIFQLIAFIYMQWCALFLLPWLLSVAGCGFYYGYQKIKPYL